MSRTSGRGKLARFQEYQSYAEFIRERERHLLWVEKDLMGSLGLDNDEEAAIRGAFRSLRILLSKFRFKRAILPLLHKATGDMMTLSAMSKKGMGRIIQSSLGGRMSLLDRFDKTIYARHSLFGRAAETWKEKSDALSKVAALKLAAMEEAKEGRLPESINFKDITANSPIYRSFVRFLQKTK